MEKIFVLINFVILFQLASGLYIKPLDESTSKSISDSEWNRFKRKLGLTDNKIEILKSQKDQKATAELLTRFMKENPRYTNVQTSKPKSNSFSNAYKDMLRLLQETKQGTFKASLNFELAEKPRNKFKRSTRKINFKLVSDIPSEKLDELLRMFNEQHGLNDDKSSNDKAMIPDDFNDIQEEPLTADSDYVYEHLWEDEQVSNSESSQFGSFQNLIMQASRQQLEREMEETELINGHFV